MHVAQENLRRTERLEHRLYGTEETRESHSVGYPFLEFSAQNTVQRPVGNVPHAPQMLIRNGRTEEFPRPPPNRGAVPDKSKVVL